MYNLTERETMIIIRTMESTLKRQEESYSKTNNKLSKSMYKRSCTEISQLLIKLKGVSSISIFKNNNMEAFKREYESRFIGDSEK